MFFNRFFQTDGLLSGSWPRSRWTFCQSSRVPMWREENCPEWYRLWNNPSERPVWSSVQIEASPLLKSPKRHLRDSDHKKQNCLISWANDWTFEVWRKQAPLIARLITILTVKHGGDGSIMLGDVSMLWGCFFSFRYWETSHDRGTDKSSNVQRHHGWKPSPSALITSDRGDGSSFSRTTTINTQPRYQWSVFRTFLWMSLNGPARVQTWIQLNISGEICALTLPIQPYGTCGQLDRKGIDQTAQRHMC